MQPRILVLSLALFVFSAVRVHAQIDATINPLGLLFGNFYVGADFALSEDFSIEGTIGYADGETSLGSGNVGFSGVPVQAVGKYYFAPNKGADNFYGTVFLRYVNRNYSYENNSSLTDFNLSRFGAGIGVGYKTVSRSNVVFDFGFGMGRVIAENAKFKSNEGERDNLRGIPRIILNIKIGVGYRF